MSFCLFLSSDDWGLDIKMVVISNIILPERVIERKLKAIIIRMEIEKEQFYQQRREIELHTELLTTSIDYQGGSDYCV